MASTQYWPQRAGVRPLTSYDQAKVCLSKQAMAALLVRGGMEGIRRERDSVILCVLYVKECLIYQGDRGKEPHNTKGHIMSNMFRGTYSMYRIPGIPQTCHVASVFRQMAWRSASAVWRALGASKATMYPATARL